MCDGVIFNIVLSLFFSIIIDTLITNL